MHFDLKPANIYLRGDVARIGDYGLSKLVTRSQNSLSFGRGTPYYTAPEILGRKGDHRSDIYSLGVMLFEMLAGEPPFRGDSEWEVLRKHEEAEVVFPASIGGTERRVIECCMLKDPAQRYSQVRELLEDLTGMAMPEPPFGARPTSRADDLGYRIADRVNTLVAGAVRSVKPGGRARKIGEEALKSVRPGGSLRKIGEDAVRAVRPGGSVHKVASDAVAGMRARRAQRRQAARIRAAKVRSFAQRAVVFCAIFLCALLVVGGFMTAMYSVQGGATYSSSSSRGSGMSVVSLETRSADLARELERGVRRRESTDRIRSTILVQPRVEMGNAMAARLDRLDMRDRSDRRIAGEVVQILRKMSGGKKLGFDLRVAQERSLSREYVRQLSKALAQWKSYFARLSYRGRSSGRVFSR